MKHKIDRYANPDDWSESFWKHSFVVYMANIGECIAVNADTEQDALDFAVDAVEDDSPGYFAAGRHGWTVLEKRRLS